PYIPIVRPDDKQVKRINVNGVCWLPLAPFRNILNGAMEQCQWSCSPLVPMDKCANLV
ncbi:5396_t:CDS:1, partial [Dentiscutata heterogama]